MKLTAFTDYSLRVLIHIASAPAGRATIAEISRAYDISENHLVKVVHLLGREGYLLTTRGRGGGLQLARPAGEIRVGDVVRATERGDLLAECFDPGSNRCAISRVCRLKGVLAKASDAFHAVLDDYTLEDIVKPARAAVAAILHRQLA